MSKTTTAETTNPTMVTEWFAAMETNGVIQWEGKKWTIEMLIKHGSSYAQAVLLPFTPLIDLSNPPAGATHYHPQDEKHPFRKKVNGVCFAWVGENWHQIVGPGQHQWEPLPTSPSIADMVEQGHLLATGRIRNPKSCVLQWPSLQFKCDTRKFDVSFSGTVTGRDESSAEAPKPQWDGTGLPPVGAECEALRLGTWIKCKVFAHRFGRALFDFDGGWGDSDEPARFRPIKTAEQLEAEKRAAEVERMAGACTAGRLVPAIRRKVCENLYDAGVRFPAEDN